jgi:phosphoglucomutase
LADNSRITARPSGTEPKIKYYFNLQGKDSAMLNERLASLQADFIKE